MLGLIILRSDSVYLATGTRMGAEIQVEIYFHLELITLSNWPESEMPPMSDFRFPCELDN